MLFFKKKHRGEVPTEEVRTLSARGMSDRDIIKELKSKGYVYEDIEKAMLQAVKEGVSSEQPQPSQFYAQQQVQRQPELPELPDVQQFLPPSPQEDYGSLELPADVQPELIIEELVEGVVQEKWHKLDERIEKLENDLNAAKSVMQRAASQSPALPDGYDAAMADAAHRLEDLEARIGGLEKAFKQFLPSLSKNIESLSGMIHEMKGKRA